MFRNRLYYSLKPLIPWSVRMGVRRCFARRKRARVADVWPIYPGSERRPEGWPGWPDGRQFAFVLTHDVEGPEGLAKVRKLAELEMSLGFRSCFNFIPEGPYRVSKQLRDWLTGNGFEVGVHDLKHDGNLFRNREHFSSEAGRINAHLRDWGAVGFRAGFMLHQLDWLHDLNIQYDCSTFDTDPFEPQPHGQHTVFPFWVACPEDRRPKTEDSRPPSENASISASQRFSVSAFEQSSVLRPQSSGSHPSSILHPPSSPAASPPRGYVELPYTLPQDSTLFLLLKERTPDIWLRKLDWIAQHGGMALVNVHPDYLHFDRDGDSPRTYSVEHYLALLRHVRALGGHSASVQSSELEVAGSKIDAPAPCQTPLSESPRSETPLSAFRVSASEKSSAPISASRFPLSTFETSPPSSVLCPPSSDSCWHVLPGEIARFVTSLAPLPARRRSLRVCMVTHSFYARDNRVIRYAESLAARGDEVDILSLRSGPGTPREEVLNGVRVFRLHDRFSKQGESATDYLFPILRFFLAASFWITRHHGRRRYDLFHIHNIPDFMVFAAWYPRLRGARIILDIHDVVPEFFASKFSVSLASWRIRCLLAMERWSARFAHHVIIANHLWLDKYATRSAGPDKCSVFINNVDDRIFAPRPRTRRDDRLIIMFPGGLQWHQGLDIGLRAFQKITAEFPQAEFHIYGDGNMKPQLVRLAEDLGLNGQVRFFQPLRVREIAAVMAQADLGVVPKRADSFGNEAYSTKIMEFMSLGVPVVVSSTRIDRFYFNDDVVRFFESGNPDAMAEAMAEVLRDRVRREAMVARARDYAAHNSWESRKGDYLNLVDSLVANNSRQ